MKKHYEKLYTSYEKVYTSILLTQGKGKWFHMQPRVAPFKTWSMNPSSEWKVLKEINMTTFSKEKVDSRGITVKDIAWVGELSQYDRPRMDNVQPKNPIPLDVS